MAGVERGRGNLGARESVWGVLPLPLSTPATQASERGNKPNIINSL